MSEASVQAFTEGVDGVRLKLIGIGGAGCNTVNRLVTGGLYGALTIAANTDKQHLDTIRAHQKILLGPSVTKFHGAGGNPEVGRIAAEESIEEIRESLQDSDLVFIAAGLGGGTGTGAAPLVAKVAKELGAIVVGVVTMPFRFEGNVRRRIAIRGLEELQKYTNTVVVIDNNRLLELYPQYNLKTAFSLADEVINNMILSITESIVKPSLINIDFEDFKAVVGQGKLASLGIGRSSSPNRAEEATFNALQSPLLEGTFDGITAAIVHVTGGEDMKLKEASRPPEIISELMGDEGLVVWGARIDNYYASTMQVALILTGISSVSVTSIGESEPVVNLDTDESHKIETKSHPVLNEAVQEKEEDELEKLIAELGIKRLRIEK